jgi:hypothetical protein
MKTFQVLASLELMLATVGSAAQQGHHHGHHAAHEHGVAELKVAVDGANLFVEFVSPLDNLVGFEHAPATVAQREALRRAELRLRDFPAMFALPQAAGCVLESVTLDGPWLQTAEHDHPHDEHAAHTEPDAGGHAELVAAYQLVCAHPEALDGLETGLFTHFPRLQQIRAERASIRGQSAITLRAGRVRLPL